MTNGYSPSFNNRAAGHQAEPPRNVRFWRKADVKLVGIE